jgi:Carboxypeptidase regulatory-like domain
MIGSRSWKWASAFFFFILLLVTASNVAYAKTKEAYIAGKVYDHDKSTALVGAVIRIVNVESGKATEVKSQEEGCFRFRDVANGTYSVSVVYKGKEYFLPEKIKVERRDRPMGVAVCLALVETNALSLLENCQICLGGGFPPVGKFILLAGPAAVAGGIVLGRDEKDPVASEIRP